MMRPNRSIYIFICRYRIRYCASFALVLVYTLTQICRRELTTKSLAWHDCAVLLTATRLNTVNHSMQFDQFLAATKSQKHQCDDAVFWKNHTSKWFYKICRMSRSAHSSMSIHSVSEWVTEILSHTHTHTNSLTFIHLLAYKTLTGIGHTHENNFLIFSLRQHRQLQIHFSHFILNSSVIHSMDECFPSTVMCVCVFVCVPCALLTLRSVRFPVTSLSSTHFIIYLVHTCWNGELKASKP